MGMSTPFSLRLLSWVALLLIGLTGSVAEARCALQDGEDLTVSQFIQQGTNYEIVIWDDVETWWHSEEMKKVKRKFGAFCPIFFV